MSDAPAIERSQQVTPGFPENHDHGNVFVVHSTFPQATVRTAYTSTAKRITDVVLSVVGLALSLPILVAVAVAVRVSGPGPILLRQPRVGRHGAVFSMIKFRSMVIGAEADGQAVWCTDDDDRVTPIGRILRARHLDELPQLWNVIVGEMSLVGPRPERPEIDQALAAQIPYWNRRYEVRPGITGLAQVRQGYVSSVEQSRVKLTHDLYYLAHCNLRGDLAILAETVQLRPDRRY
jgi:lipopolysaccharide/colanic/teichoic acid biosynthesis glycosyltransferase